MGKYEIETLAKSVRSALDKNDADAAFSSFSGLNKADVEALFWQCGGQGMRGFRKPEMMALIQRTLPRMTRESRERETERMRQFEVDQRIRNLVDCHEMIEKSFKFSGGNDLASKSSLEWKLNNDRWIAELMPEILEMGFSARALCQGFSVLGNPLSDSWKGAPIEMAAAISEAKAWQAAAVKHRKDSIELHDSNVRKAIADGIPVPEVVVTACLNRALMAT